MRRDNHKVHPRRRQWSIQPARSGVATVWLIVSFPAMLAALHLVLEVGWMHRTRSELQIAVNGAALAGARVWGTGGTNNATLRSLAKSASSEILASHPISGDTPLSAVSANDNPASTNNNEACPGSILLGSFTAAAFSAGIPPGSADERACRVSITIDVDSPFGLGSRTFVATATAAWDSANVKAHLVTVETFTCL